ncbi:preprotein translocase subunit SecA [Magnetovibrio sp. PR-2]|uniref:preprotein translocase subunit SecA n=1 Tax=Magnetovibrio sp. PR-2 TaxID=3120356 RepID=UPI002FCE4370
MLGAIAKKLFGTANDRYVKGLNKLVDAINAIEPELEGLSDDELKARTGWLQGRLKDGETLDDVLVDAFATVREAAKRVLEQRHYDVQLMGGIVLHRGQITEMKTGEGKTLTATLSVYLNALEGKGVHVVTVNDYLAKRDAEWMGEVYGFLGLTTSCVVHGLSDEERKAAYGCDVTYGTNNEFGFDYLRDNMKFTLEDMVQREFNYAIVDEVDSILIDEARTPLIISGAAEDSSALYIAVNNLIPNLSAADYESDEKAKSVTLTEDGNEHVENLLREAGLMSDGNLYDLANVNLVQHVTQALRAHKMHQRDTDYIVQDNRVVIIDEFTGRMMEGRRYGEGLHQALEAKEGVQIQNENQTLASITFQNYFRMYPKLAGMTGTAMTEAGEFSEIYTLEVVEMPTHRPCIRDDQNDVVYRTAKEKYDAIVDLIEECQERQQPVLVGTVSIEKSEYLSGILKTKNITHNVLNARHHEQEAFIVGDAGLPGAVTIATNMAGRGTDIQLGGNLDLRIQRELGEDRSDADIDKIKSEIAANKEIAMNAGGLYIVGTERHESRRIDNQLRGRTGRQGDPGASVFFLSLEDDLMRIFGSERIDSMLVKLGLEEGEAIVHPWINKALEKAQQKVEARNFEIRKNLLKFDDVMNDQRKVVYAERKELMSVTDVSNDIVGMRHEMIDDMVSRAIPEKAYPEEWDTELLHEEALRVFGLDLPIADWAKEEGIADQEIRERITDHADRKMAEKVAKYTPEVMRDVEKSLYLQVLDQMWKDHLLSLDHLRQGIGLRSYAQKDPLNEYKREAFGMFEELLANIQDRVTTILSHVELQMMPPEGLAPQGPTNVQEGHQDPAFTPAPVENEPVPEPVESAKNFISATRKGAHERDPNDPSTWGRVGRNEPCPCGSGKKFKQCHGRVA